MEEKNALDRYRLQLEELEDAWNRKYRKTESGTNFGKTLAGNYQHSLQVLSSLMKGKRLKNHFGQDY